jgi:CRISPR system Cascade subunit CasD
MPQFFTMRLAASIVGLAAPRIDTRSGSLPVPSISTITGMLGAALGLARGQYDALQSLQEHLRVAFIVHHAGEVVLDYHTVDMSKPHMVGPMWWRDSGGRVGVMERAGGQPERAIVTERPITMDYDATAVVELLDGAPYDAATLLKALDEPVFSISIGPRSCIPGRPVAGVPVDGATTLEEAVRVLGLAGTLYLPAEASAPGLGDLYASVPHGRDWRSRAHGGSTIYRVRAA